MNVIKPLRVRLNPNTNFLRNHSCHQMHVIRHTFQTASIQTRPAISSGAMTDIYGNSLLRSLHAHTMVSSPAFGGLEKDNAVDPPTTNVRIFTTAYSWSLQRPDVGYRQIVPSFQSVGTSPLNTRYLHCRKPPTLHTHCWFGGLHKAPGFDLFHGPSCSNFPMPVRPGEIDRAKPNAASNPLKRKPSTTRSRRKKIFTPKMPIFHLQTAGLSNVFIISIREQSVHTQCTESQLRNPLEPPQHPASKYHATATPPNTSPSHHIHSFRVSEEATSKEERGDRGIVRTV